MSAIIQKLNHTGQSILDRTLPRNPVNGHREVHIIPTVVEKWLGTSAYPGLIRSNGGAISPTNQKYGRYVELVQEVGKKLAAKCPRKDLNFEFTVLDSREENAWCLPGGKIGINLGLIERMEEETSDYGMGRTFSLAEKIGAVLSHEITHAGARHSGRSIEFSLFLMGVIKILQIALSYWIGNKYDREIEKSRKEGNESQVRMWTLRRNEMLNTTFPWFDRINNWILSSLCLSKSRRHEYEADHFGMILMSHTPDQHLGFNPTSPQSAIWLMHYFNHLHPSIMNNWFVDLFSTHPSPSARLKANIKTWAEIQQAK